jgi:hypothetical protein
MAMTDEQYREWALEEHARQEVLRHEAEISNLIGARKHADERREIHQRLCARHKLNPTSTTPRMLADAEILYARSWPDYVLGVHGSPRGLHVLDPIASGVTDKAEIEELKLRRTKMRAHFEKSWPPADLLARIGATDGITQSQGHNTGIAA